MAVLANTSAADVENVLANAMPFESRKAGDGETEREANRRYENDVRIRLALAFPVPIEFEHSRQFYRMAI